LRGVAVDDLTRYFPKEALQLSWDVYDELEIERGESTTSHDVRIGDRGPLAEQLLSGTEIPRSEIAPTALAYRCLGLWMRQGPVIIRPNLDLCRALHETEIRVSTREFRMPFPIIGVELPEEIVGRHKGSLTMAWKMFPDTVMLWTLSKYNQVMYHTMIGDTRTPTIEDQLILAEGADDEDEVRLVVLGGRVACNLVMLAAHRQISTTPLPTKTVRHRQGRDPKLQHLAARQFQQIVFRDLVLKARPSSYTPPATFSDLRMAPQHRRGHWRRVVHGPRIENKRRWTWISDYLTGGEDDGPKPSVVLS